MSNPNPSETDFLKIRNPVSVSNAVTESDHRTFHTTATNQNIFQKD